MSVKIKKLIKNLSSIIATELFGHTLKCLICKEEFVESDWCESRAISGKLCRDCLKQTKLTFIESVTKKTDGIIEKVIHIEQIVKRMSEKGEDNNGLSILLAELCIYLIISTQECLKAELFLLEGDGIKYNELVFIKHQIENSLAIKISQYDNNNVFEPDSSFYHQDFKYGYNKNISTYVVIRITEKNIELIIYTK